MKKLIIALNKKFKKKNFLWNEEGDLVRGGSKALRP